MVLERIASNKYVRATAKYLYLVSAWYMRRRSVTKFALFITMFIIPIVLHSYMVAQPFITQVSNITGVAQQVYRVEEVVDYPRIPCTSLLKGRVFVAGPFSYAACYYINETHVLFDTGTSYYGLIEFVHRESHGDTYAISFVHDGEAGGIRTRYLVLVVVTSDESRAVSTLIEAILRHGLTEKLCRNFVPSTSFGGRYLPHQFFSACNTDVAE